MDDREKIIEKLKKLFALGQSPNQHEAELAMAKANQIMTDYQISASDVDLAADGGIIEDVNQLNEGKTKLWFAVLANACAKLYDGKCVYGVDKVKKRYMTLHFYGTKADVLAAQMTFNHLYKSWQSIVKTDRALYGVTDDARNFNKSHGHGFAMAIHERIVELINKRQADVKSATGRDIVLVKNAALADYLKDKRFGNGRPTNINDNLAFQSGKNRGNSIPLHGAVGTKPLAIAK